VGILNEVIVLISTKNDKDWNDFVKFYDKKFQKNAILLAFEHKGHPYVWVDQNVDPNTLFNSDPYKAEFRLDAKKMLAKHCDYYADNKNVDTFYDQAKKIIVNNLHNSFELKFYKFNFDKKEFDLIIEM
jgi:hypothetical protein